MITVIILTFNEEKHLERAIRSVSLFASRVIVIDSFSTDNTTEIARTLGAEVIQHRFVNQAIQFRWALDNIVVDTDWIMRLDADEFIEPNLAEEIRYKVPALGADVVGVTLKRKHFFLGRWIRFGGRYPLLLLRLWRRGYGTVENRWMDEHVIVWGGRTVTFSSSFVDCNLNDITYFIAKHNGYATREAVQILCQRYAIFTRDDVTQPNNGPLQASLKRIVKKNVYDRIPFPIAAFSYFIYRYIFLLGFLDGYEGLIYHVLQAFWYRFLVGCKIFEMDRYLVRLADASDRREELARLSGLDLES